MKILLIQPPIEDYYTTRIRSYPLGLLFIASKVSDICDVEIVDLRQSKKPIKTIPPFKELDDIYNTHYSPFSLFHTYHRFGMTNEDIRRMISTKKPDLIGISSLFTTYFEEAVDIAKIAKEVDKSIVTVMGGNHPTLFPEEVLRYDCVDFIIRGEGELPFRMLVENIKKGKSLNDIPGLCYKSNGSMEIKKIYSDTDRNLRLKREMIQKDFYRYGKGFIAPTLTSKGCPHSCYFCGKPAVKFKRFNTEDIKNDLEKLMNLGFDTIDFEDDYLDLTSPHTKDIFKWLSDKNLRLTAMNGVIPKIDKDTIKIVRDAGFQRINLSLVDMSEHIQKETNRDQFSGFNEILDDFITTGIPIEVHFILGLPAQTENDIINTMIYLAEKKVLLGSSVYYLSPGSPAFKNFLNEHGRFNLKYARSSALLPSNNFFTPVKLATYLKLSRFINYVKSILDSTSSDLSITDILKVIENKNPLDYEILKSLIIEKRLISFEKHSRKFKADPFDRDAVLGLLNKLKFIKGYKSNNGCHFR
jgi:radical SAM superfamily enzyme YgiQ (UPF0313 family)